MLPLLGHYLTTVISNNSSAIKGMIESLDLKMLTVQRTCAERWWSFERVMSPFSRLWLVVDGRATVRHHGKAYVLRRGRIHLVPAFVQHDCSCARQLDHFHLHFFVRLPNGIDLFSLLDCDWDLPAPKDCQKLLERLIELYPGRVLPSFDPNNPEYRRLPVSFERQDEAIPPAQWLETQGILRLLIAPFLNTARLHEGAHAKATQRFAAVQEFIRQNMAQPINLAGLARVTGLNPTYFSDRFQEIVGVRPLEYLMRRRLEHAQYLLLTSHCSIKEITAAIGLRDPAYFTRVFHRFFQVSPRQYREDHRV
jgi:AraC-like DNA-binding protein